MAKRMTDDNLNRQPWFRKLKPRLKCAIRFLFDECDKAGVWVIDMETLSYFVGETVELAELFEQVNSDKPNRLEMFGRDKIFIPGFVPFQYGELTESCKPHRPIIQLLKKHGLYERVLIGYRKGIETLEEKDKEQEKEKEEDKDLGKSENPLSGSPAPPPQQDESLTYDAETLILAAPIRLEQICMATRTELHAARDELRSYHLWLIDKGQYPKQKKQVFAGFEGWLRKEKKFFKPNGTHKQPSAAERKSERINRFHAKGQAAFNDYASAGGTQDGSA